MAALVRKPRTDYRDMVAVLFSGYGNAMCDVDYFMTKLAQRLSDFGFLVIQVDPIGHGDSYGNLDDVSVTTYMQSIKRIIDFVKLKYSENIVCVGRGLAASLLGQIMKEQTLYKCVGINPYNISGQLVSTIWQSFEFDSKDLTEVYQGKDYRQYTDFDQRKRCFFNALGGTVLNLHGQPISGRLINELIDFEPQFENDEKRFLWIWTQKHLQSTSTCESVKSMEMLCRYHKEEGLPRDPIYQEQMCDIILDFFDKKEDKK